MSRILRASLMLSAAAVAKRMVGAAPGTAPEPLPQSNLLGSFAAMAGAAATAGAHHFASNLLGIMPPQQGGMYPITMQQQQQGPLWQNINGLTQQQASGWAPQPPNYSGGMQQQPGMSMGPQQHGYAISQTVPVAQGQPEFLGQKRAQGLLSPRQSVSGAESEDQQARGGEAYGDDDLEDDQ